MTGLEAEILNLPENLRCYKVNEQLDSPSYDCFLGIPSNDRCGRKILQCLPNQVNAFHFYLGANQQRLIESFIESRYAKQVVSLAIGNSSYGNGVGRDYSQIVKILSKGSFPSLKILQLGVWELFSNSHCLYGTLGDISDLCNTMPNLEELWLYGNFALHTPPLFTNLKKLYIELDDPVTGINGGNLSNDTLGHLLSGSYPVLEDLAAFLVIEDEEPIHEYTLPDAFLTGTSVPALKKIEFSGTFRAGEKARFESSLLGKQVNTLSFL